MKNLQDMTKQEFENFVLNKCNTVAEMIHQEFMKNNDLSHTKQECFTVAKKLVFDTYMQITK